jgi:uncharacterized protein YggE
METKPDTIKTSAIHREEIFASHANLYVTVKGSSVVSGSEAMKKAREVSQLVESLTRFGLSPEAVQFLGVHIESSSGALLRSSSATYRLRVHLKTLDPLADVLDILASQKNAAVERIEWKYPEDEARERGLEAAIAKGKAKAEKIAATLGVKLLGVYEFMENTFDEERPPMPFQAVERSMKTLAAVADQPSLNMDIQHSKMILVNVDIWYRVSAF